MISPTRSNRQHKYKAVQMGFWCERQTDISNIDASVQNITKANRSETKRDSQIGPHAGYSSTHSVLWIPATERVTGQHTFCTVWIDWASGHGHSEDPLRTADEQQTLQEFTGAREWQWEIHHIMQITKWYESALSFQTLLVDRMRFFTICGCLKIWISSMIWGLFFSSTTLWRNPDSEDELTSEITNTQNVKLRVKWV